MAQMKALPVDVLKVDQAFVGGLVTDAGDRAIVDATVRLAHAFGLDVVAEGVENAATVQELLNVGCYRAQGYHLSRPKPPEDLEELIATRSSRLSKLNGGAGSPAELGRSRLSRSWADGASRTPYPLPPPEPFSARLRAGSGR
jgi:predicted signal transduction protein with EAL and GGDEF domain